MFTSESKVCHVIMFLRVGSIMKGEHCWGNKRALAQFSTSCVCLDWCIYFRCSLVEYAVLVNVYITKLNSQLAAWEVPKELIYFQSLVPIVRPQLVLAEYIKTASMIRSHPKPMVYQTCALHPFWNAAYIWGFFFFGF